MLTATHPSLQTCSSCVESQSVLTKKIVGKGSRDRGAIGCNSMKLSSTRSLKVEESTSRGSSKEALEVQRRWISHFEKLKALRIETRGWCKLKSMNLLVEIGLVNDHVVDGLVDVVD